MVGIEPFTLFNIINGISIIVSSIPAIVSGVLIAYYDTEKA